MDKKGINVCHSTQIVGADGSFNVTAIDSFIKKTSFSRCGTSYAVVSIIGSQSSGKSTLLNHLFSTTFEEMDESKGRFETTKGIWLAKAVGISQPFTLAIDIEGIDGSERGQDDTFEKQSALFALAISDIVLINMPYINVGLEHAANKPLLGNVIQVMMKLFDQPDHKQVVRYKTTLMFVIRDKSTKTSLEILDVQIRKDIEKIWKNIPKPQALEDTQLSEFFNIEIVALSHYEFRFEQFNNEVASLRQMISNSIARRGRRYGAVPASGFSLSTRQIWSLIKENKDLNLLNHRIMVSTACCDQILQEKFKSFCEDEELQQWEKAVKSGLVPASVGKLTSILSSYLSEYDAEVKHFDERVRSLKQTELKTKLLQAAQPAYFHMLRNLRIRMLCNFKRALHTDLKAGLELHVAAGIQSDFFTLDFNREVIADTVIAQANWDFSEVRNEFQLGIDRVVRDLSDYQKKKEEVMKVRHANDTALYLDMAVKVAGVAVAIACLAIGVVAPPPF